MADDEPRKVDLDAEDAAYVDAKVASGEYASARDVIRDGLTELRRREAEFERWLREEVNPVYDALKADPSRAIPSEQVIANMRARHEARSKSRA